MSRMTILAYAVGFQETHVPSTCHEFPSLWRKINQIISKDDPYLHNHGQWGIVFSFFI